MASQSDLIKKCQMSSIPVQGELVECSDPAIYEYIKSLHDPAHPEDNMVLMEFPPVHLFVKPGKGQEIREAIHRLIKENTFYEENRTEKK